MRRHLRWTRALLGGALALLATPGFAKEKISFAYVIDPFHEAMLYAARQGKVTSDKVDLDLRAVELQALLQGTAAKRFDLVETAAGALPRALSQGLQLKIVATALRAKEGQGSDVWVTNDSPLQSGADLKGKLIGMPSLNSTSTTLVRIALWKAFGYNIAINGGDFRYLEMPSPALAGTLQTKRVDAAVLALSHAYRAKTSGEFRSIATTNKLNHEIFGGPPVSAVVVGYPEKLSAAPEAYRAALDLMRRSRQYALDNSAEVFRIVGEAEKIDAAFFETCLREYYDFPVTVAESDVRSIQRLWEFSKELGLLAEHPTAASTIWEHALR